VSGKSIVDLLVGNIEFDTSKTDMNETNSEYMINGYDMDMRNDFAKARTERLRAEKALVHRELHPLFHKTMEQLRNYDFKLAKDLAEQKRKSRDQGGNLILPGETEEGNSEDSEDTSEVVVVHHAAKKRRFKIFTKENTGKKKYGGWSEEGIDRMEKMMKAISVDRGEVAGPGTDGALRNRYWNFENAYYEWEDEAVGGYNYKKRRGQQDDVEERKDSAIASVDAYKLRLKKKKQRSK
jgi:hypothetical protein